MDIKSLKVYLDELLEIEKIDDVSLNGLIIYTERDINRIGLAVDTSLSVIEKASNLGLDLIIVHHGLYWGSPLPITGALYKRIKLFMESGIGLYVAHLPLDGHPVYGNNIQGIKLFEPDDISPILDIGFKGTLTTPRDRKELLNTCKEKINPDTTLWDFGPDRITEFAFISGDALSMLPKVINLGIKTYITGEPKHSLYLTAQEEGVNVFLTGHYMSETLGVKALGKHLEEKFGIETVFLDSPTGY